MKRLIGFAVIAALLILFDIKFSENISTVSPLFAEELDPSEFWYKAYRDNTLYWDGLNEYFKRFLKNINRSISSPEELRDSLLSNIQGKPKVVVVNIRDPPKGTLKEIMGTYTRLTGDAAESLWSSYYIGRSGRLEFSIGVYADGEVSVMFGGIPIYRTNLIKEYAKSKGIILKDEMDVYSFTPKLRNFFTLQDYLKFSINYITANILKAARFYSYGDYGAASVAFDDPEGELEINGKNTREYLPFIQLFMGKD